MSQAAMMHPGVEPAEAPLTPESWGKLGMWLFLVGDAMGFGVLLCGYGAMRYGSADWPNPFRYLGINLTAFMTFLLICSSVTMVKGLEAIKLRDRGKAKMYLLLTAIGGAGFLGLQAYEWTHLIESGLKVYGNPWGASLFGTTFFIITGFHGMHVTGGVIYLLTMLRIVSKPSNPLGPGWTYNVVEIAGLYWHFVDLVWIMVFTFVYLL
ncbi:MAG TPA: cytochrome c oxidase subunit 3 [Methylomirabilota bacterium]|nr:cytochrome c oxidase subunit 3 [Methylomirabilota bacterium]